MWMVRCNGGDLLETFLDEGIVSIGWHDVGNLKDLKSRDRVIEKVRMTYPQYKPMKAVVVGSQLNKIANVIKAGDAVITYDPSARLYHLGKVMGDYEFRSNPNNNATAHRRRVKWEVEIERDKLSVPTKNSLGSTLSIFEITGDIEREIENVGAGGTSVSNTPSAEANETLEDTKDILEDTKTRAKEFIKDKIVNLDWDEMQELVAGVLRAMGYKTRISPEGSDRGKDIIASPDGLGLEQPRIVVEVKHRQGAMNSQAIRSFLGGRHKDDKGLYVSTGGFSKDAKYEAERASIPLTLIDVDDLVNLVIENYEAMDTDARALIPLTKIYWPS